MQDTGASAGSVTPSQPSTVGQPDELHCPLCTYNLRGLSEPRCPECGYRFEWADLTDPTRKKHPYLFEHHPERNVWSFAHTALGLLLPRRFWRTMRPEQPSNERRLVGYWVIAWFSACVGLCAGMFLLESAVFTRIVQFNRPRYPALLARQPEWRDRVVEEYGSVQAFIDAELPLPLTWSFFRKSAGVTWRELRHHDVALATLSLLFVWPWLIFFGLASFRLTMRRARIRSTHVLRCVLYSYDLGLWFAVAAFGLAAWRGGQAIRGQWGGSARDVVTALCLNAAMIIAAVSYYRLVVAHWIYLRFDHVIAMVTAVHAIIALSAAAIAFYTPGLWEWLCNYFVRLI